MKWWWTEGWNGVQTPILRECWMFLIYIFLHQKRKQCLEFALPKPGEICNIWLVLTIHTVMPVGYTILLLSAENKQRNQRNGASPFKEKCLRKAQHYQSSLKEEKALCKLNSLTLPPLPLLEVVVVRRKKLLGRTQHCVSIFRKMLWYISSIVVVHSKLSASLPDSHQKHRQEVEGGGDLGGKTSHVT